MTEEQTETLLSLLERVALALEALKPVAYPNTVPYHNTGGYQCMLCFNWVNFGAFHSCSNNVLGSGGGATHTATVSALASHSHGGCTFVTAAGMKCLLTPGHGGGHDLGID